LANRLEHGHMDGWLPLCGVGCRRRFKDGYKRWGRAYIGRD